MKTSEWFKSGTPWIWMNAAAVAVSMIMVFGLLILIMIRGLGYFWPADVVEVTYLDKYGKTQVLLGEHWKDDQIKRSVLEANDYDVSTIVTKVAEQQGITESEVTAFTRFTYKVGNRDIDRADFRDVVAPYIVEETYPDNAMVVIRREYGNLYGYLVEVKQDGKKVEVQSEQELWTVYQQYVDRSNELQEEIHDIERSELNSVTHRRSQIKLEKRRNGIDLENEDITHAEFVELNKELDAEDAQLVEQEQAINKRIFDIRLQANRDSFVVSTSEGGMHEIPVANVVYAYQPNKMDWIDKSGRYVANMWEFISENPREANSEGGVFPAIFGTVVMVMIMAILVTPLGVIAAVYLREYAKQGPMTRAIRIAVNNLAGVPSIVYGVFGLGFFVYILGGAIDDWMFPEYHPSPKFGTPGIMWASITLAILTLPVVIVATEEGLSRVPRSIREGSLALGATKIETLWKTVIPMASPAIMTGLILAVARAAGEVAPLMMVGAVKLAPELPIDTNLPFIHFERQFMHLGFHIYDVGFQSSNSEAARPLVYATSFLLVLVILVLNMTAIRIRNTLREKYRALEN